MTKQTINYGAAGSGSGGDTARTALQKLEANFNEIFSSAGSAANAKALNELAGAAGTFGVFTGAGLMRLASIIGAVAQSGGVPTGAIIERGSNANGEYVRYADGTQICFSNAVTLSTLLNAQKMSGTWTFPAQFSTVNGLAVSHTANADYAYLQGLQLDVMTAVGVGSRTVSNVILYQCAATGTFTSGKSIQQLATAIGRWF